VLNLEGLWTRYEDPQPLLDEIAEIRTPAATPRMQEIYAEPIKPELITARLRRSGTPASGRRGAVARSAPRSSPPSSTPASTSS
jgi:IMP dehydrogenase